MRATVQKRLFHSASGKKAQIMSVDSSISYLLFALFLLYMSNYIINISSPFGSYINYEEVYKNSESLSASFEAGDVSKDYLNSICSSNYPNVVSVRASYEAKSLMIPAYDSAVNSLVFGIHLRRNGYTLSAVFNTGVETDWDFIIITNGDVFITGYNTEAGDDYNITREGETVTASIHSDNSASDSDNYELSFTEDAVVFFNYYDNALSQAFVGSTPLYYSCGDERALLRKSYFSGYAQLSELNVIASYGVEVWWQ